jgi:hypothetical protein
VISMWPDKKFVAIVIVLLLFIGVTLYLSDGMMRPAVSIPSEEGCQNAGPAGLFVNYNWCECEKHLVCAHEWDHNCRIMEEKIECHLNKTLAGRWDRINENLSGAVET